MSPGREVSRRRALLIGVADYSDTSFTSLESSLADVKQLYQVLKNPHIGDFDSVNVVCDPSRHEMMRRIEEFCASAVPDEMAVLYISGHGSRLVETTGEFFFIASDSESDDIESSGVPATFVNQQIAGSVAAQKVCIVDCCYSGGLVTGFTSTAKSKGEPELSASGVWIMSSSGAREVSYGGHNTGDIVAPSVFTGHLVHGLASGDACDSTGDRISMVELFDYVNQRVRETPQASPQVPTYSSLHVTGRIEIAKRWRGPVPPLDPHLARSGQVAIALGDPLPALTKQHNAEIEKLVEYYRRCIVEENRTTALIPLGGSDQYVCVSGKEQVISGNVDQDGTVAVPPGAGQLIDRVRKDNAELWIGYPTLVFLESPRDGKAFARKQIAPLYIRRVELVETELGQRLEPWGEAAVDPRLAAIMLDDYDLGKPFPVLDPSWHAEMYNLLVRQAEYLLKDEFGVRIVQSLRPEQLEPDIDSSTPISGARNCSILFVVNDASAATAGLLDDFAKLLTKRNQIGKSALRALLAEPGELSPQSGNTAPRLVLPLKANEAQEEIIRAAMTQVLTVATGPPGTGKSQLVTNLVATAIAKRESVVIASTNNQAVDEVWERCEKLVPGAIVRTGNKKSRGEEEQALRALLRSPEPVRNVDTATSELDFAQRQLTAVRAAMAAQAQLEQELLDVGQQREDIANRLNTTTGELAARLGNDKKLNRWVRRTQRTVRARFFSTWRRNRLLEKLGWTSEASSETLAELANFASHEQQWRRRTASAPGGHIDRRTQAELDNATSRVSETSIELLATTVAAAAYANRTKISAVLEAKGFGWSALAALIQEKGVRAWAITNLSARRLPPDAELFDLLIIDEASQCSIPSVIPLLFRAKRALIIGDPMQLGHIAKITPKQIGGIERELGLSATWLESRKLSYDRHSSFHALEHVHGPSRLLDEHFRCHPHIIDISNRLFYENQLEVFTDVRGQLRIPTKPAVIPVSVSGSPTRPGSGSWLNRSEIEETLRCVDHLLELLPENSTVGVVTPFVAQASALRERLRKKRGVRVGTIHTFQGGEQDAMVLSLVAGHGMPPSTVGWLQRERKLWNVAITRARSHLVVVGDRDFWVQQGGLGKEMFDAGDRGGLATEGRVDDLSSRLYRLYRQDAGPGATLAAHRNDHPVDLIAPMPTGERAFLIDRGCRDRHVPAQHFRRQLTRAQLAGGAVRIPAWRLYDERASFGDFLE